MSQKIKVEAYSGFKANERPLVFFLDNRPIRIRKILKQWKDPECDCFRLMGEDNNYYELRWDRSKDHWTVDRYQKKNNEIA